MSKQLTRSLAISLTHLVVLPYGNTEDVARAARLDWLPLGKRHNLWPPRQVVRSASFWRSHALAHGARGVDELVLRCWQDVLADFGRDAPNATNASIRFFPYMNLLASRARLRSYPLAAWRAVHGRLMRGLCLREPERRGATLHASRWSKQAIDGPSFDKLHASAMEVLQDAIFGGWSVYGGASIAAWPRRASCALAS